MQTLYDVLKVQEDAPTEIIRAAYIALSSMDLSKAAANEASSQDFMQKLNNAYRILSDPDSRARYNEALSKRRQQLNSSEPQTQPVTEPSLSRPEVQLETVMKVPTHSESGSFLANLWRGHMGLFKTYWVYGVIGGFLWGIALSLSKTLLKPGSGPAMILVLAFFAYLFIVYVGTWRAANLYTGEAIWANAAKLMCLLPLIGIVSAVSLPAYQDYTKKAQIDPAPSANDWGQRDLPASTQSHSQIDDFLKDAPAYQPDGWTQYRTDSTEAGPWLSYANQGTRFCREADRKITEVYPPGLNPQAEPASPACVMSSVSSPQEL